MEVARASLRGSASRRTTLDEFLELALNYERKAPASLQSFMAWLRAADTDVKRDMEIRRDEVRVMTVHGAKGLEAPVVFLVDTTSSPAEPFKVNLVKIPQGNAAPNAPGVMVWAGRKTDDPPQIAAARAAMQSESDDEYRRLLYVAMTRAADRLIVGGVLPGQSQGAFGELMVLPDPQWAGAIRTRVTQYRDGARPGAALLPSRRCRSAPRLMLWRQQVKRAWTNCPHGCISQHPANPRRRYNCVHPIRQATTQRISSILMRRRRPALLRGSAARLCIACCNRCPILPPTSAPMRRTNFSNVTRRTTRVGTMMRAARWHGRCWI